MWEKIRDRVAGFDEGESKSGFAALRSWIVAFVVIFGVAAIITLLQERSDGTPVCDRSSGVASSQDDC